MRPVLIRLTAPAHGVHENVYAAESHLCAGRAMEHTADEILQERCGIAARSQTGVACGRYFVAQDKKWNKKSF
ncbi:hypothetical protein [Antarcticimicrobium luteum]|uniref:Uncharacterized protein n=1 Tax=Antarcticimicrobium luteum TaxID=2547397 RepID=A0A4R5VHD9_9RHOB|nr:hypothetical protein [Antarcticimicrobium luteum]TDK51391.1 hypothetical protein E1832_03600 [Antarcticimicrobium luteum]